MPSVIVVGGGLAGLATAAALGDAGFHVDVLEARPYPGGRATSYPVPFSDGTSLLLDNSQHILLRCCHNLLDFYRRLGVADAIDWHDQFYFIEPGGRISEFGAGVLPAPLHFTESFLTLSFLSWPEKLAVARGMLAIRLQRKRRTDLDQITMADWLNEQHQPERVIQRFWRQVLVSAVNEELDVMSAAHGFQVIAVGFLGEKTASQMGVPSVTLGELYQAERWTEQSNVRFRFRHAVTSVNGACVLANGNGELRADYYVVAVPFERAQGVIPGLTVPPFKHSPIIGVHLWFERSVTDLPHATLLDSPIHWMFNKGGGQHLQVVISASRSLVRMTQPEIVELCTRELRRFFPLAAETSIVRSRVIKEVRATFSASPGMESKRPGPETSQPNVFVAGDWTRTGWPSTMEGAVRSGYTAAEAVTAAAGRQARFLIPS